MPKVKPSQVKSSRPAENSIIQHDTCRFFVFVWGLEKIRHNTTRARCAAIPTMGSLVVSAAMRSDGAK